MNLPAGAADCAGEWPCARRRCSQLRRCRVNEFKQAVQFVARSFEVPFLIVVVAFAVDGESGVVGERVGVTDWLFHDVPVFGEQAADGGLTPYLHVRADLWAKVTRALYYDLVDMGEERMVDGQPMFGVESAGEFFAMADAEQVRAAL